MPVDTELPQPGSPHTRPNQPSEGVRSPTQPTGVGVGVSPAQRQAPTDTGLPPGAHPMDQAGPDEWELGQEKSGAPYKRGRKPFADSNAEAFQVFERSASHFRTGVIAINSNEGGTAQVVGRQPGRVRLILWIPTTNIVVGGVLVTPPNGVLFAATEGEMQGLFNGSIINVGDSVSIESEASVHVGLIPGATVGYVQYLDLFNPPSQGITGNT